MVIHNETELVVKLPIIRKPLFEDKSYVVPVIQEDNHENNNENEAPMSMPMMKSRKLIDIEPEVQVRLPRKRSAQTEHNALDQSEDSTSKISIEDLEELRTVYKKCKSVIRKIEAKYGHLLDLDEPGPSKKRRKNTTILTDKEVECQCTLNKKIVFDDNGKEIAIENNPADHICPKIPRYQPQISQPNDLQIEYYNQSIELPDSLQELKTILQNPEIEIPYRNQVIQKVREIKQEFANEIKFNKRSIVDKIKADFNEMVDFKGTNLSTLPGYIDYN